MNAKSRPATAATLAVLAKAANELDLDEADFERATRGLVATHPTGVIDGPHGPVWDVGRHDFIRTADQCPDTVHPSLWRQARLNAVHGLFRLDGGLYQARGYDLSNITFIEGERGWIVIDPLTTDATAAACLELANAHLGHRPVSAVIYTHSHVDHFGGAAAVVDPDAVAAGNQRIIAPEGFLHEAVAENVIAGMAMARRGAYQFGPLLAPGPTGHVDSGLGKTVPLGSPGLIPPTEEISATGTELVVDGVRIVFQNTPEAEAPAEMNFFFPDRGWLCMAENCTHTMHNLLPIRGAQARDSLAWSKYIGEARELWGSETHLLFASHHWPRWGQTDADGFLRRQRDLYRWMHDQTMRWANHGETPVEIAERLKLPPEFQAQGHTRGYYGALVHNVKAIYQRYFGWYDGNPANLWALPPTEVGPRYVELAGGPDAVLTAAQSSYDAGDYRWVAELLNHLVFADPTNTRARELQAATFEQLGYQAESSTWRNTYLTGAKELRDGPPPARVAQRRQMMAALTVEQVFDALAVRLRAEDVGGINVSTNWRFTDIGEDWIVALENRALRTVADRHDPAADATVTLTRTTLTDVVVGEVEIEAAVAAGDIEISGNAGSLADLLGHLDTFQSGFNIVEP